MKRWKVIVWSLFIIGIFTVYYVEAANELNTYPIFTVETKEGEDQLIQDVSLYGDYVRDGVYYPFSLTRDEVTYAEQVPYLERLNGFHQSKEINRLRQLYPAFMRGKMDIQEMYTESDVYVVQTNMKWGTYSNKGTSGDAFELAVLHKELDKQVRFTIPVPEADQPSFMMLENAYAIGERLHLITSHEWLGASGVRTVELRMYTVQLDRGKIAQTHVIHTWKHRDTEESDVVPVQNKHSIVSGQRMLLVNRIAHAGVQLEDFLQIDEQQAGQIHYELFAYDFRTKSGSVYELPDVLQDQAQLIAFEDNRTLYATQLVDGELQILSWDLGEEEQVDITTVPGDSIDAAYTATKIDDYFYIQVSTPQQQERIGELHLLHVPTSEWVYRGDVTIDSPLRQDEEVIFQSID